MILANDIAKRYWSNSVLSTNLKESHLKTKGENIVNSYAVDDLGFLISPEEWTEAFAASALSLLPHGLSSQHKDVIQYVRSKYLHLGALPLGGIPDNIVDCHSTCSVGTNGSFDNCGS